MVRSLLFIGICSFVSLSCHAQDTQPMVCHDQQCVKVEVVSKQEDLMRGLQGRVSLPVKEGMLFVFQENKPHHFWMKDMNFSIDMIWLDEHKKIVYIAPEAPPCRKDPCEVYAPGEAARYVLEVKSGYSKEHRLKVGDEMEFLGKY